MSKLISGKEAIEEFINGNDVEFMDKTGQWRTILENTLLKVFLDYDNFRLKPRTIIVNNIEVPAPFEPKDGDRYYFISNTNVGYDSDIFESKNECACQCQFGAWRTEEEIKQVVEALRSVFKPQ